MRDLCNGNTARITKEGLNDFARERLLESCLKTYGQMQQTPEWNRQKERMLYISLLEASACFIVPSKRVQWIWNITDLFS